MIEVYGFSARKKEKSFHLVLPFFAKNTLNFDQAAVKCHHPQNLS